MKKGYNLLILDALKFFTENPYEKIHLREFARKLKISVNSANRFLDLFLKMDFLIEERLANLRYFKANLESKTFREIKKTLNIFEIEQSGLLKSLKNVCFSLILFGSVAKGIDSKESDLDFLIICKNKILIKEKLLKFQNTFRREISSHIFSPLEWKKQKIKNKAFYQDVISTGINLIGEMPL